MNAEILYNKFCIRLVKVVYLYIIFVSNSKAMMHAKPFKIGKQEENLICSLSLTELVLHADDTKFCIKQEHLLVFTYVK